MSDRDRSRYTVVLCQEKHRKWVESFVRQLEDAVASMSLEALAAGVTPDDDEGQQIPVAPQQMPQQPETGGGGDEALGAGADGDEDPIEALSGDEREYVRGLVGSIDKLSDRTPRKCAEWEEEVLEITGADDLDECRDRL